MSRTSVARSNGAASSAKGRRPSGFGQGHSPVERTLRLVPQIHDVDVPVDLVGHDRDGVTAAIVESGPERFVALQQVVERRLQCAPCRAAPSTGGPATR